MRDLTGAAQNTRISTVGYEKSAVEQYVQTLVDADIDILVDVRERPISRKKGFSKTALGAAVEACGIEYLHIQALGDPKPGREAARAGQHDLFVSIFTAHMKTEAAKTALANLAHTVAGKKVCLTCFERDHQCCHRSIVASQLAELLGTEVVHLKV